MKSPVLPHVSAQFMESERASELYVDEVLDGQGSFQQLDWVGSVSAVDRDRGHLWLSSKDLDEQVRRALHGS